MKVGDYCYIKGISRDYGIGQITQLNSGYSSNGGELIDIQFKYSKHSIPKKDVISSPNIIDILEVDDYVNGYKVLFAGATTWDNDGNVIDKRVHIYSDGYDRWLSENYIKSVLTHEQFEAMKYVVGEE